MANFDVHQQPNTRYIITISFIKLHPLMFTKEWFCLFVRLFDLILYVPSTIFQLNMDGSCWVELGLSEDKCVFLKDHNAVTPVRLEPAAPRSRVKLSTTKPLHSH